VADQIIKSARTFLATRHARDGRVRDGVRERDAARINEAVLTIVAEGAERMTELRKNSSLDSQTRDDLDHAIEVVDWGVRTFGSYVGMSSLAFSSLAVMLEKKTTGWIDINLTVTPTTVPLLFTLLADPSLPIRLATSVALLRIVSKGLKEPGDKLQLLKVLSLGQVLEALESKTRAQQAERGQDTDEGEETYREALGNLLNVLGQELTKLADVRAHTTKNCRVPLNVILLFCRIVQTKKSELKHPLTSFKSNLWYYTFWQMNMMIHVLLSFHFYTLS
jgi:exportin-T